jgi:DNA-binding beta-propeller fold protein YncE
MNRIVSLGVSCLVLVSAGCADDAAGPARPRMLLTAAPTSPTHPAGVIKLSAPLPGRPYGLAISTKDVAYITQLDASRVARVDLGSGFGFTASIPVGFIPTSVAFDPNGQSAWVTNQLSSPSTLGKISVDSNAELQTFASGGPSGLNGNLFEVIAISQDKAVYVSSNDQNVYVFDPEVGRVTTTLALGGQLTNGFALQEFVHHPDGVRLYADQISSGTVAEIDTRTQAVVRTFKISPGNTRLQGMAVSLDGSQLYVADEGGVLRVVDIASGTQVDTVVVGQRAFGVALSPDNVQLYVGVMDLGLVRVIDRASLTIVNTIQLPEFGAFTRRIAFNGTGTTAVITDENGYVHFVQ